MILGIAIVDSAPSIRTTIADQIGRPEASIKAKARQLGLKKSQDYLKAGGSVAVVQSQDCTGCLTCIRVCPFDVPKILADVAGAGGILGAAYIEPAVCQGCGICVAECPAKTIDLMYYTESQLKDMTTALLQPVHLPLEMA